MKIDLCKYPAGSANSLFICFSLRGRVLIIYSDFNNNLFLNNVCYGLFIDVPPKFHVTIGGDFERWLTLEYVTQELIPGAILELRTIGLRV